MTVHSLSTHFRRPSTSSSLDCTVQPLDRPLWPKTIRFRPDPLYQFNLPTSIDLCKFIWNFPTSLSLSKFNLNFPTSVVLSNFIPSFLTSAQTFQLQSVLSNFARFFPTSLGSFQLQPNFPTSAKLSNFRLSNLKLSNFSFFPTALSNYTYPSWLNWVDWNIHYLVGPCAP